MGQSWFSWNGVDCRSMGVIMTAPAAIIRPEERVQHIEIPGRAGDLTQVEGENIFNSYIQTASIAVRGGYRVRDVYKWLRGAGEVTFSGEPDRKQDARIIGAITLNKHSRNMDYYSGECQFYCQPLKKRLTAPEISVSNGDTIRNDGDVMTRPRIRVKANATTVTAGISGAGTPAVNTITLTGVTSGYWYVIDSNTLTVSDWERNTNHTDLSSGEFPIMSVGANVITLSGVSEAHMFVRERFM